MRSSGANIKRLMKKGIDSLPEDYLHGLYRRFLSFEEDKILEYITLSNPHLKLTRRNFKNIYNSYYRPSFYSFLKNIRHVIYSSSLFEPVVKEGKGWEWLLNYIEFLVKEGIATIDGEGRGIILRNESLRSLLPPFYSEQDIQGIVENRTGRPVDKGLVSDLFNDIYRFSPRPGFDQGPISQESALFVVKKILDEIPARGNFLFIGDDDFLSVLINMIDPEIKPVVVDIDKSLLQGIDAICERYNLSVTTIKGDIRKESVQGFRFMGFHVHPPYIEGAIKKFIDYGLKHLSVDGGIVSLIVGDLAIGNRYLHLQKYFSWRQLLLREYVKGKIYYPCKALYREEEVTRERFSVYFHKDVIDNGYVLGAGYYLFDYIPFKVERIRTGKALYQYL